MSSPLASPQSWDLVADAYAAEIMPVFEAFATEALRYASPPPRSRIVDVACGPGTLAIAAARTGLQVDALDFSPRMIAGLVAKVAADGIPGITPCVGNGEALPYADATFAAAFSLFGLMFFPDRARGIAELRRVLVPGGRAVITSWQPPARLPVFAAIGASLREAVPGPVIPPPLTTPEVCRAEMAVAFADVEVHATAFAQPYASPADLWAHIERTLAPVVWLRRQLAADRWLVISANVLERITQVTGDGPGTMEMAAWMTVGTAR